MTPSSIQILDLSDRSRLDETAAVLAESFYDAPQFMSVWSDKAKRKRLLPAFFRVALTDALWYGHVSVALEDDRIAGVAVWLPPGHAVMTLRRQVRAALPLLRIALADPRAFPRLAKLGSVIDVAHPKEPHWYLVVLGVIKEKQGQGVGSYLVREGLGRSERTGYGCYLETMLESNVRLYEKHGFNIIRYEESLLPGGPPFWFMWRPVQEMR